MTTSPGEATTRRLLGALFELENVIRSLSGRRRAAAITLVTERMRRLRTKRGAAPAALHPQPAQIDLEELLDGRRPARRAQARRRKTSGSGGKPHGATAK